MSFRTKPTYARVAFMMIIQVNYKPGKAIHFFKNTIHKHNCAVLSPTFLFREFLKYIPV